MTKSGLWCPTLMKTPAMSPLGTFFKNCGALKSKVENQKVQFFAVVSIYSVQRCLGKCKKSKIAQINVLDDPKMRFVENIRQLLSS